MLRKVFVVVSAAALLGLGACSGGVEPVATEPVGSAATVKAESVPEPVRDVAPEPDPEQVPEPDYEALADAVIRGDYGDGEARRLALGADYEHVQAIVNERMPVYVPPVVSSVAPPVVSVAAQSQPVAPVISASEPVAESSASPIVAGIPIAEAVVAESPESQWAAWIAEFGEFHPSLPSDFSAVPACAMEDGSMPDGYAPVCYWDAVAHGNGDGTSYVLVDGDPVIAW